MLLRLTHSKFSLAILLVCLTQITFAQDDASQLGFTALQSQANALVEDGNLVEALPLLKELVKRVEASENTDIELDFPVFLIGTAHIQQYVNSGQKAELTETLKWYDKMEAEFPKSPKIKDMLLKRIDVNRVLGLNDEAIAIMQKMLSGAYGNIRLSNSERIDMLKDLTQIYYGTGQLEAGLPYFGQLLEIARDPEDQALAAAASFEALFQAQRMDDALRLLPQLARESEVRYRPRLNVALLKASDALVDAGRLNEAALTLNLIKTTDIMIQFHEDQIAERATRLEQRIAFGNASEEVERLQQEIQTLESNLVQLRELPSLRNELLVRRARNYTKTARRYEAFWMFNDLMEENPTDDQAEFYTYATFSNALQIGKSQSAIAVGQNYLNKFPEGDYYSDVTGALAVELRKVGDDEAFLALAIDFIGNRPLDAASSSLFAQWASYLIEEERYTELIAQAIKWREAQLNPVYEDGTYYWVGIAELQLGQFEDAVVSFDELIERFPPGMFGMRESSPYAEDGLLRKGAALFYAQRYEEARETLYNYTERYPEGNAIDQAYFFLGEVEYLAGNPLLALEHLRKADQITTSQDVHNGSAFRIGAILEELGRYEEMAAHFEAYIQTYGEQGDLTRAVLQLGLAFEYLLRPVEMLSLYRKNIEIYVNAKDNSSVDALIESYAEKYNENKTVLTRTVAFLDRLVSDTEFRKKIVTDRGFLFEYFYVNGDIDQALYNKLREHPDFSPALVDDLSPINDLLSPYREQLEHYPVETPEDYFKDLLAQARAQKDVIAETRMLMGLYRLGVELAPSQPYNAELIEQLTPRAILYVADYERDKRLPMAEEAWNQLLINYPTDDATIVAFMRLADITAEKGDRSGALNYLEQIVTQFPGSPKIPAVMLRQGELLSELNRGQEAREKYQYILRVPGWRGVLHARALYQIGESYMAENAYAEAHGFFERTFLGYPHLAEWSARAYLADAEALLGMGARQDAIKTLQEAIDELNENAPSDILQSIKAKLKELGA
jgi:TolA-binding protein